MPEEGARVPRTLNSRERRSAARLQEYNQQKKREAAAASSPARKRDRSGSPERSPAAPAPPPVEPDPSLTDRKAKEARHTQPWLFAAHPALPAPLAALPAPLAALAARVPTHPAPLATHNPFALLDASPSSPRCEGGLKRRLESLGDEDDDFLPFCV